MIPKFENGPDGLGVLLLTTIALLDVTKSKLHPVVDSLNVLSMTEMDMRNRFALAYPKKALSRLQLKVLGELKASTRMMRQVADSMDTLIEGIEKEMEVSEKSP